MRFVILFQICVLLLKGNLCGSGCRIGFCIRELCTTLGRLRIDCAALQSFYIALLVGGEGALYFIVGLVAGLNMKSGRVHLEGEGVAGAVYAGWLHALTGGI